MRRFLSLVLCVCAVLAVLSVVCFSADRDFKTGEAGTGLVKEETLRVRVNPDTTSAELGTIKKNAAVRVTKAYINGDKKHPNYHEVKYNGRTGYVVANDASFNRMVSNVYLDNGAYTGQDAANAARQYVMACTKDVKLYNGISKEKAAEAIKTILPSHWDVAVTIGSPFTVTSCTESAPGSVTARCEFASDGKTSAWTITFIIPKGTQAPTDNADTSNKSEMEIPENPRAEVIKAASNIGGVFKSQSFTNTSTQEDFMKMANAAVIDMPVTVTIKTFSLTPSTYEKKGEIKAQVIIMCGEYGELRDYAKQLPLLLTNAGDTLKKDAEKVHEALTMMGINNRTTKEQIVSAVQKAVSDGVQVTMLDDYRFYTATFEKQGFADGTIQLSLGGETVKVPFLRYISQFERKIPHNDISISQFEWGVIRYTNIERHKRGYYPLSANKIMQEAADIREAELFEKYSHTRPDGCTFDTVFPENYVHRNYVGENICGGPHDRTDLDFANAWMASPGHKQNMLDPKYGYIGMGHLSTAIHQKNVQLFSVRGDITKWTAGNGTGEYNTEEDMLSDYLILTDKCGCVSYMPMDLAYMTRGENGYTLKIDDDTTAHLKVANMAPIVKPEPKTAFTDVIAGGHYEESIAWALERGVTSGTSATTFSPDATCTRGQVVTFLWRAKGKPQPTSSKNPFTDVKKDDYFYNAVLWAVEEGITSGTSTTTFSPNNTCTTAQVLTFIFRALDESYIPAKGDKSWAKYGKQYYGEPVSWANKLCLVDAFLDDFNPNSDASRAEIVYYLFKSADSATVDTSGIEWSAED